MGIYPGESLCHNTCIIKTTTPHLWFWKKKLKKKQQQKINNNKNKKTEELKEKKEERRGEFVWFECTNTFTNKHNHFNQLIGKTYCRLLILKFKNQNKYTTIVVYLFWFLN